MNRICTPPVVRPCAVGAMVLACFFGSEGGLAGDAAAPGERIQFSDPNDGFHVPASDADSRLFPKTFDFLDRQSSLSGVMAPDFGSHAQPNGTPNARLLELFQHRLDQKKNWVYQRSEDTEAQPTLEEMFGVRENRLGGKDQQGRGVLAVFFEGSEKKEKKSAAANQSESNPDSSSKDPFSKSFDQNSGGGNKLETPAYGRLESSLEPRGSVKTEFAIANGFFSPQPDAVRPDESLDPNATLSRVWDRDREPRSDDFRKLLVSQTGINPLVPGFDPINLRSDATRLQLNPITPLGVDNHVVGLGSSTEALVGQAGGASRSGALFDSSPATLGSSSLAPAVSTPVTPQRAYQPAVLEFPKRRF